MMLSNRCPMRKHKVGASGYYGVFIRNGSYGGLVQVGGKFYTVKQDKNPENVAKEVDRICMEIFGPRGCRNFSYEYYLAFEPHYLKNVQKKL